MQELICSTFN